MEGWKARQLFLGLVTANKCSLILVRCSAEGESKKGKKRKADAREVRLPGSRVSILNVQGMHLSRAVEIGCSFCTSVSGCTILLLARLSDITSKRR